MQGMTLTASMCASKVTLCSNEACVLGDPTTKFSLLNVVYLNASGIPSLIPTLSTKMTYDLLVLRNGNLFNVLDHTVFPKTLYRCREIAHSDTYADDIQQISLLVSVW